jgi:16S rRNA (uracil1498-N3)-methyltransferase
LTPIALAVGPEGGFTDDEVDLALGLGWRPIALGPRILRIETAAVLMVAMAALGQGAMCGPNECTMPGS